MFLCCQRFLRRILDRVHTVQYFTIRRIVARKALTSGSWAAHHWHRRRHHPAGHTWQRNRLGRRLKIKCVRNIRLDGRHVRFGLGGRGAARGVQRSVRVCRVRAWRALRRCSGSNTGHRRDHGGVHQKGFERHGERRGQRQTLLAQADNQVEGHTELLGRQHTVVVIVGQGKNTQQHRLRQARFAEHFDRGISLDQTVLVSVVSYEQPVVLDVIGRGDGVGSSSSGSRRRSTGSSSSRHWGRRSRNRDVLELGEAQIHFDGGQKTFFGDGEFSTLNHGDETQSGVELVQVHGCTLC
mmetsp:Transcript_10272/g.17842  ORF Transcript_10272/g.17842 Transcript_10272/m.17842 type:complete len:296 (-) Transcript_10272:214-1101(-)